MTELAAAPRPVPWLGIIAVLFGAIASTLTSRLTSSGLADIRGAIGADFDEGSWILTAFGAAQMVIGPTTVFFGRLFGLRNVLLVGCATYGTAELLIPVAPNLPSVVALQVLAGSGAGTFIPLTIVFILLNLPPALKPYGIAAYAMNIILGLNIASALEGWYSEHATWKWIFWQNSVLAVPLFVLFWFGMPRLPPDPAFRRSINFLAMFLVTAGFALLYIALDQGDRLDWGASDLIVGMALAGAFLIGLFFFYESVLERPGLDFAFVARPVILLMATLVIIIRFLVTGSNVIVPGFLTQVRGLRPLEIGEILLWVALPQLLAAPFAAWLVTRIGGRMTIIAGIATIVVACVLAGQLTSAWAEPDFDVPLLIQAVGQSAALTALICTFILYISPADALTFGAFIQMCRIFGGELGTAALTVFTRKMEQVQSHLVGLHVGAADPATLERLSVYGAGLAANSQGTGLAEERAVTILSGVVRAQAFTLTYADAFWLSATVASLGLLIAVILPQPPAPRQ
jgi:DHA2 family multidrug resistance protein